MRADVGTEARYTFAAEMAWSAIRAMELVFSESPRGLWATQPIEKRRDYTQAAKRVIEQDLSPRQNHEAWRRQRESEGWRFGNFDREGKLSPDITDWQRLTPVAQARAHLFVEVVLCAYRSAP